jgi:hypothetical protein
MAYADNPLYMPYSRGEQFFEALKKAIEDKKSRAAVRSINRLLDLCYPDIYAHKYAITVHEMRDDAVKLNFHRRFYDGILMSILNSGDGRSFDTAYLVIDYREEYAILEHFGYERKTIDVEKFQDHEYDVYSFIYPDTEASGVLYFNIDLPRQWLAQKLEWEREVKDATRWWKVWR